jgi:hypothetical protein
VFERVDHTLEEDEGQERLARYCARNPVALERLTYDRAARQVTYRSDKSEGPTAGTETADPLEFLARVLTHIPDKGQVTTRYYGWYANRPRGMRRQVDPIGPVAPLPIVVAPRLAPTEATRRWASLLQQIFEADPLACPRCHGTMRILAFITQTAVIDQILSHLRTRLTGRGRSACAAVPTQSGATGRGPATGPTGRPTMRVDGPRCGEIGEGLCPHRTRSRGAACRVAPYFDVPD